MRISQFQKYSQKENTVTNNILLMLSRLNDLKVEYYKSIIEKLSDGVQSYEPQANFLQQIGSNRGIIDGFIEVKASKIVIETKLSQKELINKLTKYGDVFKKEVQNQLFG
jgi:argonaute-like protein implicated in RNA metabolism and viral defense